MEKNTEAAQPPPYSTLTGAPRKAKKEAASHDTLGMPQRIMDKVLTMRPHAERVRLIKEYTVQKGQIIEAREAALTQQDRALADAIKRVKSDLSDVGGTIHMALWGIGTRTKHRMQLRGYIGANFKYAHMKSELAAYPALLAAGDEEARRASQAEYQRIETEFRDAVTQFDKEYMVYVEEVLAKLEGNEESK
ncbi:hypothetical protein M440DRAFT_1420250 [Trichoderma longibrachiatum ATCC 18648]|uniref:Uncharacterized protein n=1 Tax=Trichoderma longibrachiatum ATCC 18648 TaxID=983965 RepID=A0A2T4C928_TRILO|nr:hypothetical protein M440DRAFT_1420250 [Trichoderma longibrachiatum ATCC 18648]